MTKKTTKRSLAMSILSLVLCLAMLIGSTYAWFSDTATTKEVTITAGNLDVDIVNEAGTESLANKGIFTAPEGVDSVDKMHWEPGVMLVSEKFKIKNNGSLALKYQLDITAEKVNETAKNLLDVVKYKVVKAKDATSIPTDGATLKQRQDFWNSIGDTVDEQSTGILKKKDSGEDTSEALQVVLFWNPTESTALNNKDNYYNIKENYDDNKLSAEFTLNVFATQASVESDSFGDKYDNLQIPEPGKQKFALKDNATLPLSESKQQDRTVSVSGNGTLELASGVIVENTYKSAVYSMDLGDGKTPSNITLSGSGTVKKPNTTGKTVRYAVNVNANTTVTVQSGTYEGFLLDGASTKLVINGGKITGVVNIIDAYRSTDCIVINDGDAVKDAVFVRGDESYIKLGDNVQGAYTWQDAEDLGSAKGMKLVPISD